jgi:hypothetical protein
VLARYEQEFRQDHAPTLQTVANLGDPYRVQGKHNEAEQVYLQAIVRYEKKLGLDHTLTLILSVTLHGKQGTQIFQRALVL